MKDLLTDLLEYMESRADADIEGPNKEMGFQIRIEEALAEMKKTSSPEPTKMQYNVCRICGASDGRAGILFGGPDRVSACKNCEDTRQTGKITVHTYLDRTVEELQKTMDILDKQPDLPAENTVMWWLCRIADDEVRRKAVERCIPKIGLRKEVNVNESILGGWVWGSMEVEYWDKIVDSVVTLLPTPEWKEYLELRK